MSMMARLVCCMLLLSERHSPHMQTLWCSQLSLSLPAPAGSDGFRTYFPVHVQACQDAAHSGVCRWSQLQLTSAALHMGLKILRHAALPPLRQLGFEPAAC